MPDTLAAFDAAYEAFEEAKRVMREAALVRIWDIAPVDFTRLYLEWVNDEAPNALMWAVERYGERIPLDEYLSDERPAEVTSALEEIQNLIDCFLLNEGDFETYTDALDPDGFQRALIRPKESTNGTTP